jgi:hypothetical protein
MKANALVKQMLRKMRTMMDYEDETLEIRPTQEYGRNACFARGAA